VGEYIWENIWLIVEGICGERVKIKHNREIGK